MPTSPLAAAHEAAGARFTDFGGWDMPVQYESVLVEHRAVREATGVFDVTHLGRFRMEGSGATDQLRSLLCNDVTKIEPGRAQYTMMLNPAGGVIDDIIVWRLAHDSYWVLPNGVNQDRVMAAFADDAPPGVAIESTRETTVLLAVQGPTTRDVVEEIVGWPGRFRVSPSRGSSGAWVAGTGYTGERGVEVAVPNEHASELWNALISGGGVPCGLGARDTLRLEMGYPLWGQDIDETTTPLEAGLGWVVAWDHDFVGREALAAQRDDGMGQELVAFALPGRQIARHGAPLRAGASSGEVTSGNYSPSLGHAVGLGYLAPPVDDNNHVEVEIRGKWVAAQRVELPFLKR